MDFNQFACAQNLREVIILCALVVLDSVSCHYGKTFSKTGVLTIHNVLLNTFHPTLHF